MYECAGQRGFLPGFLHAPLGPVENTTTQVKTRCKWSLGTDLAGFGT